MNRYLKKIAEEVEEPRHPYGWTTLKAMGTGIASGIASGVLAGAAYNILSRGRLHANPDVVTTTGLLGAAYGAHHSLKKSLSNKQDYDIKDPDGAASRALYRGVAYGLPAGVLASGFKVNPILAMSGFGTAGAIQSIHNTEKDGR